MAQTLQAVASELILEVGDEPGASRSVDIDGWVLTGASVVMAPAAGAAAGGGGTSTGGGVEVALAGLPSETALVFPESLAEAGNKAVVWISPEGQGQRSCAG